MNERNNGGPAFPVPINPGEVWTNMGPCDGMSLRDYFAAEAMAACITALGDGTGLPVAINDERLSERAYEIADAMLAARG